MGSRQLHQLSRSVGGTLTRLEDRGAMTGRPLSVKGRTPWVVGVGGMCGAMAAAALRLLNGADPDGVNHYAPVTVALGAVLPVLGALILRRYPGHPVGRFLVFCGMASVAVSLCNEWLVLGEGGLPGSSWAAWVSSWLWLVGFLLLPTVLVVIFPTGDAPTPRWRPVLWAIVAIWVVDTAWMMAAPLEPVPEGWSDLENPLPWLHAGERLEDVVWWWPVPLVASFVLAVGALVRRLGLAVGVERRQLMPFALAAIVQITWLLADLNFGLSDRFLWPDVAAALLMPAGAAVGMLRYQLFDVDRIISRSLTLLLVTVGAGCVYGLTLSVAGAFFVTDSPAVTALGAGLLAAAALPLWRWANDSAERLLFGDRAEPGQVIRRLGAQLEALADPTAAPTVVVDAIATSLRLPWVAVDLTGRERIERGVDRGEAIGFGVERAGRDFGVLLVAPRSDVDPLSPGERHLLADLARQLGEALHVVELTEDLQAARDELVRAREEERRRIRDDLHDGLGPQLAGIGLQLDIARNRLGAADPAALTTLETAKTALGDAIADIRRLVEGLRPPALDEVGLVSSIRRQVAVLSGDGPDHVEVSVRAPDRLGALPAAVEVAAFRIVTEAVSNTVRHSGARRCLVTIRCDQTLDIEVRDDGRGMAEGVVSGIGMTSMRQRAEELGGRVEVDGATGGTVVRARLPLRPVEVAR